jgi:hypothetical protein
MASWKKSGFGAGTDMTFQGRNDLNSEMVD